MNKTYLVLLIFVVAVSASAQTSAGPRQKRNLVNSPIVPNNTQQLNRTPITVPPPGMKLGNDKPLEPVHIEHIPHQSPHPGLKTERVDTTPPTFMVTTTNDTGAGSFRKAIHDANNNSGPSIIQFDINGGGVQTIQPKTYYEVITSPVTIDGTTQSGYVNQPLIELDGTLQTSQYPDGIEIDAQGVTIRGLAINRFRVGIVIDTSGGDIIEGNYIGTDPTGEISEPNWLLGIGISGPNNHIGGTAPGAGNVIQGIWQNIEILGSRPSWLAYSSGNVIQGNILGLDAKGTQIIHGAVQDSGGGISIFGASNDTIGGVDPGARNIITGNQDGIYMGDYSDIPSVPCSGNIVQGNYIGLDITGTQAPGNTRAGITIFGAYDNLIGGTTKAARNYFAKNAQEAVRLRAGAYGNIVEGNYIGTDTSGTVAFGNYDGIYSGGAGPNQIGGITLASANLIAGNQRHGIFLDDPSSNIYIQGNLIGVTLNHGTLVPLGNGGAGIFLVNGSNNLIGGTDQYAGNVIGGNTLSGIDLNDGSNLNTIQRNFIGTDQSRTLLLGNKVQGIFIDGSSNTIGGTADTLGNVIANNSQAGVYINNGTGNTITSNSISLNGSIGIDLDPPGHNQNDSGDADVGPNDLQNYPVIDSILRSQASTVIKADLNSVPNSSYLIQFFESAKRDPSLYGPGETHIASINVNTNNAGLDTFAVTVPYVLSLDSVLTATATNINGSTSEFSRIKKLITLSRPSPDELWNTGDIDTIRWTVSDAIDYVNIEYSTDGGNNFTFIPGLVPATQGQLAWKVPNGILTRKAKIHIFDWSDPASGDTSQNFRIKGYELTLDSADQYVRYTPTRHGWRFPNADTSMWPQIWWSQFNYLTGTDPLTGSLYIGEIFPPSGSSVFPDWPLVVETFGTSACYFMQTQNPTQAAAIKPSAVKRWKAFADDWGGSCFGLSLSSFLAFDDQPDFLNRFSDIIAFYDLHDLYISDLRRKEINRLMITQFGKEDQAYSDGVESQTPNQTITELKAMFNDTYRDDRTLNLIDQFGNGGHAVNPYRVVKDAGTGHQLISVYDNNWPGDTTLTVEVDSVANTWVYDDGTGNLMKGSTGLTLSMPMSNYLSSPTLSGSPKNERYQKRIPFAVIQPLEIYNTARCSITIADETGDTIGYNGTSLINKMPQAIPRIPRTVRGQRPIGYSIPSGRNYSIRMSHFLDTSAHFEDVADSSIVSFSRSSVQQTETDDIRIRNGYDIINHDPVVKIYQIESIIITSDNEKVIALRNTILHPGDSIHIDVTSRLDLNIVSSADSLHYDLNIQHSSSDGTALFTHSAISNSPHTTIKIVPAWDSIGYEPVKILLDTANSGTFNDSVSVNNQSSGWFPDSLHINPDSITGGKPSTGSVVLNTVAPHGGMLVHLSSSVPLYASVPPSVFIPVGQQSGLFNVTTSIVTVPETVMISASANGITIRDSFYILPQGIESLTLNPPGGVVEGDSAIGTVTMSNPAPAGGELITLSNGRPSVVTIPASVIVPQSSLTQTFKIYTSHVVKTDSAIITASSAARQASAKLYIGPFGLFRFDPDTVVGGQTSMIWDSSAVPAPPTGIKFVYRSSDSVTARTDSVVFIPSGAKVNYHHVSTIGVGTDTVVTFTVTNTPYPVSHSLLVRPAGLVSVLLLGNGGCFVGEHGPINLRKFIAGNLIRYQVWLDGAAPPTGAKIKITSDHPSVVPADSVIVPYLSSVTTHAVMSTDAVASPQMVVLMFSYLGKSLYDTVTIFPRLHYRMIEFADSTWSYTAMAINNAGRVLANSAAGLFFWQNNQVTLLSSYPGYHLNGNFSQSQMNDSGHIVGNVDSHAAYWKPDTTIVLKEPPGYTLSTGISMNNHDDVVGTIDTSGYGLDQKACVWSGGTTTVLDDYGPVYHSFPYVINDARQVVGEVTRNYYGYDFASAGVLWENGHISWSLPGWTIGVYNTPIIPSANAINDSGIIAGTYYIQPAYSGQGWFIRRGADTINFQSLPPYYGMSPLAINSSGVIAGNMWEDDFESRPIAFLYKDGYYYDMNCITDSLPPGRELAIANSINDQGVIAGAVRLLQLNTTRPCVLIPTGVSLGVNDSRGKRLPTAFKLRQNFPDPFNPVTTIQYELPRASHVSLKVYNQLGQEVATLVDGMNQAGVYTVRFGGQNLSSGVYYYRLIAGSYSSVKKMLLIK